MLPLRLFPQIMEGEERRDWAWGWGRQHTKCNQLKCVLKIYSVVAHQDSDWGGAATSTSPWHQTPTFWYRRGGDSHPSRGQPDPPQMPTCSGFATAGWSHKPWPKPRQESAWGPRSRSLEKGSGVCTFHHFPWWVRRPDKLGKEMRGLPLPNAQ